jgi:hypothetical protein
MELTAEKTYFTAGSIKALGDGRIGGYLVVWGNPNKRDLQGEYFTPHTEFELGRYTDRPILYHHELSDEIGGTEVGRIDRIIKDAKGLWAEGHLHLDHATETVKQAAQKVYQQVLKGLLGWSSGTVPHWADVTPNGQILRWPIVEGSLTPDPAEPHRTTVAALKSATNALNGETQSEPKEATPEGVKGAADTAKACEQDSIDKTSKQEDVNMDYATLIAALEGAGVDTAPILEVIKELETAPEEPADGMMADGDPEEEMKQDGLDTPDEEDIAKAEMDDEEIKADDEEDYPMKKKQPVKRNGQAPVVDAKAFAAELMKHMKAAPAKGQLPAGGKPEAKANFNPRIEMRTKYADLSPRDMGYLHMIRHAYAIKNGVGTGLGTAFYRELTDRAQNEYIKGAMKLAEDDGKRLMAIKANELNNASNDSDWVPTLWSSDLWERMRVENMIAASFQMVEMPSASYELPIESTDPTVYLVPETTAETQLTLADSNSPIPDSTLAVGKVTLTAKKLALRVGFSAEIMEDSIIQFIPQLRAQGMRTVQDAIDNVLLNGDDETGATNISYYGSSPTSTDKFLAFDGLRALPLVNGSDLTVDAGGASPTLSKIRTARFKLANAYAMRPNDLVYFVDVQTYGKLLGIDELLVYMNNGEGSTVNTGMVPTIDGSPVFPSQEFGLSNTSGYVHSTTSNNTKGSLLIVHKPSWKVGYRRNITSSIDFLPYYDSYQMTMTVRIAFKNRDNTCASLLYNIGVS